MKKDVLTVIFLCALLLSLVPSSAALVFDCPLHLVEKARKTERQFQ